VDTTATVLNVCHLPEFVVYVPLICHGRQPDMREVRMDRRKLDPEDSSWLFWRAIGETRASERRGRFPRSLQRQSGKINDDLRGHPGAQSHLAPQSPSTQTVLQLRSPLASLAGIRVDDLYSETCALAIIASAQVNKDSHK